MHDIVVERQSYFRGARMARRIGIFLLTIVSLSFVIAACDRHQSPTINGKTLEAKMSDEQMLAVFGIEPAKATSQRSQGPDGYSTHYTAGEQKVGITRSVVTGIYVMADGPIKGEWKLGKP